jgi:putative sigma-54 modulation protein
MARKSPQNELQITFAGKNVELSDGLRAYAQKRLHKLAKHFARIQSVEVVQGLQRSWYDTEITVHADGIVLRAVERSTDAQACLDQAVEKLQRQLDRYREKLIERSRQEAGPPQPAPAEEAAAPAQPARPRIVRVKRFAVKPMAPEEAAMQMDLLGHDFFVFANSETEQVNVIYRRNDGHYGLIEPEL